VRGILALAENLGLDRGAESEPAETVAEREILKVYMK